MTASNQSQDGTLLFEICYDARSRECKVRFVRPSMCPLASFVLEDE